MTIRRQIACDIPGCQEVCLEAAPGDGWPGWATFNGIALNGIDNPCLCPAHKDAAAAFVDSLKG